MSQEKRHDPRLKIRVPVELRAEGQASPVRADTTDLSAGGFYVEMMFTLEVGTKVDLTLQLGEATIVAMGEVVTCDRTVGNGIHFTKMLTEDREELARFLEAAKVAEST